MSVLCTKLGYSVYVHVANVFILNYAIAYERQLRSTPDVFRNDLKVTPDLSGWRAYEFFPGRTPAKVRRNLKIPLLLINAQRYSTVELGRRSFQRVGFDIDLIINRNIRECRWILYFNREV